MMILFTVKLSSFFKYTTGYKGKPSFHVQIYTTADLPLVENRRCSAENSTVRRLDGLFEAFPEPPIYLQ
jgi:hypothetical protein